MSQQRICANCQKAETPVTERNGSSVYVSKDGKRAVVVGVYVHRACFEEWKGKNGGTIFEAIMP